MNRNAVVGVATLIVAVLLWGWNFGWFSGKVYSDDPLVAKLEKERDQAFAKLPQMSDEQRREQRQALEKKANLLSPEQRMALFESSMPLIIPMAAKRFEAEYDKFMAMSPEEQRKELDKRINEMKARGGPGEPGGGGGNGGRRGPPNIDPKKAEQIRKKMLDWTTPEQRAKFENGINLMNGRLKERGMDPLPPGPGGGFF